MAAELDLVLPLFSLVTVSNTKLCTVVPSSHSLNRLAGFDIVTFDGIGVVCSRPQFIAFELFY